MLASKYPDVCQLNAYISKSGNHKSNACYSIGNDGRFKMAKSNSVPGPGHYRTVKDFPDHELHDVGTKFSTTVKVQPCYEFPRDSRVSPEGVLKGIARPKGNPGGPGQHEMIKMNVQSKQKRFSTNLFPKAKESQEALRERKRFADAPGPGAHDMVRSFETLPGRHKVLTGFGHESGGDEKAKAMERAYKAPNGRACLFETQYSHIFTCMKLKPREPKVQESIKPKAAASAGPDDGLPD